MKLIPEKAYYRPDELAMTVGVSTETVRRWIRKGIIVHVHFLGFIRIPRSEFERVLRDGCSRKDPAEM